MRRVYPRAGGGTLVTATRQLDAWGLSPRRRGNRASPEWTGLRRGSIPRRRGTVYFCSPTQISEGLSPRRRGNRDREWRVRTETGSIPAQAGEPQSSGTGRPNRKVYPRAGGGTR